MKKQTKKNPPTPAPLTPTPTVDAEGRPLYAGLLNLVQTNRAELFAHAKLAVEADSKVEKAKTAFNACKKFAGKVMAAMQVAYATALNERSIRPDATFEDYHEQNTGAKPNARIQALGRLFNRVVELGFLAETVYDAQTVDALEAANAAISAIEKKYKGTGTDPKTTPEFNAVVNALKGLDATGKPLIGTDATKTIKAVNKTVKGGGESATTETGEEPFVLRVTKLTPELALQLNDKIWADGQQDVVIATLPDQFAKLTPEARRSTFLTLDAAMNRLWKAHEAELNAMLQAREEANAPVQVLTGGIPAENTPGKQLQAA